MDNAQKKVGAPWSISRNMEKAVKKQTHKKRRAEDRKEARDAS